ncbi:MAG: S-layer protein [Clostridiales bacterium]|nr:S-layer protein [Clostridiales bacterium]
MVIYGEELFIKFDIRHYKELRVKTMDYKKMVIPVIIALLLLFNFSTTVLANSLDNIYDEVSGEYPEDIEKMKENGASEGDIKKFINTIGDELSSKELDDENISEEVANVVLSMYLSGEHDDVFNAVIKGWGLSPDVLIEAYDSGGTGKVFELLPKSLQEIGYMVKEQLAEAAEKNIESSDLGNSAEPVVESNSEFLVESSKIIEQINKNLPKIIVNMPEGNSIVEVRAADIKEIFRVNKELEVQNAEGDVIFTIPPGTITINEENNLKFNIKRLPASEARPLAAKLSQEIKVVGDVFELNVKNTDNKQDTDISLNNPITAALSYENYEIAPDDEHRLAVFMYNESTNTWDLVGGKVNKDSKTVEWKANHFSKYAVMLVNKTFTDITDHWAKQDIEYLVARGLVNGVNEKNFEPMRQITRAEFTKMLVKVLNIDTASETEPIFADVPVETWYSRYVSAAFNAGLVNGVSSTHFEPNRNISRQEMAAMIVRALNYKGIDTEVTEEALNQLLSKYKDSSQIADWAKKSLAVAIDSGIIGGRTEDSLAPTENTVRAEAAVMIKRLFDKL